MPLFLEFRPRNEMIYNPESINQLNQTILHLPYLNHQGAIARAISNGDNIKSIEMVVKGISTADAESDEMLVSIIHEKLEETDSPFYLSSIVHPAHIPTQLPNEALFMHERLKPGKSKNVRNLAHIADLNVPEEFICPLSGEIMDEPVYDIRSPGINYDRDFLMYWINKSVHKFIPHTRLIYAPHFIEINYGLSDQIHHFVQESREAHKQADLHQLYDKYQVPEGNVEELLRRVVVQGNRDEFVLTVTSGAHVNTQNEKGETPLHLALRNNQLKNARELLWSGAKINVFDNNHVSAFELIRDLPHSPERTQLTSIADHLGLETPKLETQVTPVTLFGYNANVQNQSMNAQNENLPQPGV